MFRTLLIGTAVVLMAVAPASAEPVSSAIAAFINALGILGPSGFTYISAAEVSAFAVKVAIVVGLARTAQSIQRPKD